MLRPTTGIAQRTHTRPIAPAADGRDYSLASPHPYLKIQILTDHSSAAFNGASEVFPPGTLSSNLCTEHARGRWLDASANKALFNNKDNIRIVSSDIQATKNYPFLNSVDTLKEKMVRKWTTDLGEGAVAEKWFASWGRHKITRIESNFAAEHPGGITPDQNGLEGANGTGIKGFVGNKRYNLSGFFGVLGGYISAESSADLSFGETFSTQVNSNTFNSSCEKLATAEVSPFTVSFPYSPASPASPSGWVLIAAQTTIERIGREVTSLRSPEDFKRHLTAGPESLKERYLRLRHSPEEMFPHLSFDDIIDLSQSFYVMKPIHPSLYSDRLYERLTNSGFQICPLHEIVSSDRSLMSCGCRTFLHYAWCHHSCAYARRMRIITAYPKDKDPTKLQTKKRGRPSKNKI